LIALDTNILVYSHRPEMPFHGRAVDVVRKLAEGQEPWGIPWPCIHEFLAIATHPRIFVQPTPMADALRQVAFWRASSTLRLLGESTGYFSVLQSVLERAEVSGPRTHDARIAAICIANGVGELWSADRDLSRFTGDLRIRNPL